MMIPKWIAAGMFLFVTVTTSRAVEFQLAEQGLVIDVGTSGKFCLEYPALTGSEQEPTKPSGVEVKGNTATISYPSGVKLTATRTGATVALHFTGVTDAAKGFRMEMTLPVGFKNGGKFQLQGEAAKPFPAENAGEQFVFRGNPKPFALTTPGGETFTLAMPYGWDEMSDGRKWNSEWFQYRTSTEMPRGGGGEAWYTFKVWSGGLDKMPGEPKPVKPAPAPKVERKTGLHLGQNGLVIDAGSMGQFTLAWPVLVGERWDAIRKPIEHKVSGNTATIQFEGDARIDVALKDGALTMTPANLPGDAKSIRAEMMIDFNFATGGSWKVGDGEEKLFPSQKPDKPFLFQGNADTFVLRNFEGATLKLQVPQYSYQQLTDNREWGWKIFHWQFSTPCQPGVVKIAMGAPTGTAAKLVDKFGQSALKDFAGKVKSEDELKADVAAEAAWLASLQPPAFDTYGGLPGSREKFGLQKTGFFHVEKKDKRWILVDPDGNAFFHLGVCGMQPSDDYTYVKGRENVYEWLPPRDGNFATAYHPNSYWNPDVVSFHLANLIRKTGAPYTPTDYTTRMIERLRKWGFNSGGAFGGGEAGVRRQAKFASVASLPLSQWEGFPEIPGTHGGIWDPFDEKLRALCEKNFAEKIAPQANDSLIIGYYLVNEPLYQEIPAAVAALDSSRACKRRLAQMLEEKYKTIEAFNQAWEMSLVSFADVAARGLSLKRKDAKEDMKAFTGLFIDTYFKLVTDTFHKHDKNHLLIGTRLQPGTIKDEQLCQISGKYMDLISFNYYTYTLDKELLDRIYGWTGGRPMFLSEFHYNSPKESGLAGGGQEVVSQQERGLAYRQYVEHAAATGYVVGIEWFTLVDQATTGRFFERYSGESANTGLIAVSDRPFKDMLVEMMKTNYDIYKFEFGEKEPFQHQPVIK